MQLRPITSEDLHAFIHAMEADLAQLRQASLETRSEQLQALKASRELVRAASSLNCGLKNLVLDRGIRCRERLAS
jgi:hypothetical protein